MKICKLPSSVKHAVHVHQVPWKFIALYTKPSIPAELQLLHKTYSFSHFQDCLSIARYTNDSVAARQFQLGSFSWEYGVPLLTHHAPHIFWIARIFRDKKTKKRGWAKQYHREEPWKNNWNLLGHHLAQQHGASIIKGHCDIHYLWPFLTNATTNKVLAFVCSMYLMYIKPMMASLMTVSPHSLPNNLNWRPITYMWWCFIYLCVPFK